MATLNRREKFQAMGRNGATSERAQKTRTYPLRKVVDSGTGLDPEHPSLDRDLLECGHLLRGAEDMIGRRWPARRRCWKCAKEVDPQICAAPVGEDHYCGLPPGHAQPHSHLT